MEESRTERKERDTESEIETEIREGDRRENYRSQMCASKKFRFHLPALNDLAVCTPALYRYPSFLQHAVSTFIAHPYVPDPLQRK